MFKTQYRIIKREFSHPEYLEGAVYFIEYRSWWSTLNIWQRLEWVDCHWSFMSFKEAHDHVKQLINPAKPRETVIPFVLEAA